MMRIPRATYRLQMMPTFRFADARSVAPYLAELGVSDLYVSPIFQAVKGSTHGYDVVDPTAVNEELGGREGLMRLHDEAVRHNLGWLQDIVPNHMAFDSNNRMLMDVLENGPSSRYVSYFDIDWNHSHESLRGRVLAPFLGKFYGEALEAGEITLRYDASGLSFNYYDLRFPARIESYVQFFTHGLERLEERLGGHHADLISFIGTVHTLLGLPGPEHVGERAEQIRHTKTMLWQLHERNDAIREFVAENLREFNGDPENPESFQLLDRLLGEQYFRLAFWKVATEEINYRRFFTINNLISLRLEDPPVFRDTHSLIAELVMQGVFDGLRVDHVDGLNDPTEYLDRLREIAPEAYILVEKILEQGERLPNNWPVQGTTGYDFLNVVNGIFCRRKNGPAFSRLYARFAEFRTPYARLAAEKKRLMIDKHLAGNIDNLANQLKLISSRDRYGNDITLHGLRRALVEVMAQFPVYRTYVNQTTFREADRGYIEQAVGVARANSPALKYELDFIEKFLLMGLDGQSGDGERQGSVGFTMHFQQVTSPLMAKGVEDTSLYVYNRMLSLNEVGGSPETFGLTETEFHEFNRRGRNERPHGLNTTATHDTKRGEDARARLNVLSEIPSDWDRMIRLWRRMNKRRKVVRGERVPDKNDEYFLYQALIASWPFAESERESFTDRFKEYVVKATREAKVHTAWLKPDEEYEQAYLAFIDGILAPKTGQKFLESFLPFQRRVAWYGMLNSLGQLLIKLTAPGVPDIYQGTELWDLSMVDPDNRRPVDYEIRRAMLRRLTDRAARNRAGLLKELLGSMADGRIKLFTMHEVLQSRRQRERLFREGDYVPVEASGTRADNVIAFARHYERQWALTVAPRFFTDLVSENQLPLGDAVWGDTLVELPQPGTGRWRNVLTGQTLSGDKSLRAAEVFAQFPVALLVNEEE